MAALAAALLPACSSGERAEGATLAAGEARAAQAARLVIPPPSAPYVAGPVANAGTVAGLVRVEGEVPQDTMVRPTMDTRVCGTSFVDRTIVRTGAHLGGAVVWLTDVRSGKPLPLRRRFEVSNVRCQLEPRVQAVVAGGTLNVRSEDAALHRTRIVRQGAEEPVAVIRQDDFGQVVPHAAGLREPGLLELRSDVHPWTRGWVAVFDHPYFAVTPAAGVFSLDSVPPGDYVLAAWHERFGRVEQPVRVEPGAVAQVTLTFGADAVTDGVGPTVGADSVTGGATRGP